MYKFLKQIFYVNIVVGDITYFFRKQINLISVFIA